MNRPVDKYFQSYTLTHLVSRFIDGQLVSRFIDGVHAPNNDA